MIGAAAGATVTPFCLRCGASQVGGRTATGRVLALDLRLTRGVVLAEGSPAPAGVPFVLLHLSDRSVVRAHLFEQDRLLAPGDRWVSGRTAHHTTCVAARSGRRTAP